MRLILSQAQQLLAEFCDYGLCATDPRVTQQINLAIERLMPLLNPEKTLARFEMPVIRETITMPPEVKTVLAANLNYPSCANLTDGNCSNFLVQTLQVRNKWYEMIPGGPAGFGPNSFTPCSPNVLLDLGTGWSTLDEPWSLDAPMFLRVYADLPQAVSEGVIFVNGLDANGNSFVSYDSAGYHQAMQIPIPAQGQNYVDSPSAVSQVYNVVKPLTKGRIRLYAVSLDGTVQDPVAIYPPDVLAPDYRRYRLTWCGALTPATIILMCKRQFIWTSDPDADLLITNVGALQEALMALKYSKAGTPQLADYHWKQAGLILESETIDYDTDKRATMQLQDTFAGGDIWNLR